MKKILFAASECVPFMKTGGLADVVGALPKEFDKNEWDVRVVMPNYRGIPEEYRNNFEYVTHFYMGVGPYIPNVHVGIMKYVYNGITYYFIDNLDYFGAWEPYSDTRTDVEDSLSSVKQSFRYFLLSISVRTSSTVMTGRQG